MYPLLRDGLWLTARWFRPTKAYGHEQLAADYWRMFSGVGCPRHRRVALRRSMTWT